MQLKNVKFKVISRKKETTPDGGLFEQLNSTQPRIPDNKKKKKENNSERRTNKKKLPLDQKEEERKVYTLSIIHLCVGWLGHFPTLSSRLF